MAMPPVPGWKLKIELAPFIAAIDKANSETELHGCRVLGRTGAHIQTVSKARPTTAAVIACSIGHDGCRDIGCQKERRRPVNTSGRPDFDASLP